MRRRSGFRVLLLLLLLPLLGLLSLAVMPLPLPEGAHLSPRWVGPVQVVDVETGSLTPGRALRLEEGRIVEVVEAASVPAEQREGWFDAQGAHVVPGLWDMHAVLIRGAHAVDYPLHLAHGVTRLRSILNCPHEPEVSLYACQRQKRAWNAAVREGKLLGPVVMSTGSFPINGPERRHPATPQVHAAATAEQARALVELYRQGPLRVEHLKTYDGLSREEFLTLARTAREAGLEVSGHVPRGVTLLEAAAAGMKAVAHARVLPISCSSEESALLAMRTENTPNAVWMRRALDSFDPVRCARLWEQLRAHGTFLSPTLLTRLNESAEGVERLERELLTDLVPPLIRLAWEEDLAEVRQRSAADEATYAEFFRDSAWRVRDAEAAGVRLLVGTDTYEAYVLPGIGLHQEMALWREAGVPPLAILRAATVNAAAYYGLEASHGQVREGFVADLLFLEGDPLRELSHLRRPRLVMLEGRLYTREVLEQALSRSGRTARGWQLVVHTLRDWVRNPRGF